VDNLRNILKKINIKGELRFDESMSMHTTFETGGPADIYTAPADEDELLALVKAVRSAGIPAFILGGGANLLVSDLGIRGAVIDMKNLSAIKIDDGNFICQAGAPVDSACEAALEAGLGGLDAFYGMPGTIGGAVWMNARCYGISVSDIIRSVKYADSSFNCITRSFAADDFSYKLSPFQGGDSIILEAVFSLPPKDRKEIKAIMHSNREDRRAKGHYSGPSAGSVFKNNRDFGKPSGVIIDSLGMRGTKIGKAKISDGHANIFINTGGASSEDIYRLIKLTIDRVSSAYGYLLEPEVQLIGDFSYIR